MNVFENEARHGPHTSDLLSGEGCAAVPGTLSGAGPAPAVSDPLLPPPWSPCLLYVSDLAGGLVVFALMPTCRR